MATKPLTNEAIALTEKKVDMALDDIIKMSKSNTNKGKKEWRSWNKNQKFNVAPKDNALKARQYMDSRSVVRQGAYAKRRSNFQGSQFPRATNIARRAAATARPSGGPLNAGRMANINKSRVVAPPIPGRAAHGGFPTKAMQQRENVDQKQAANGGARERPQTLDSLFANMQEERRRFSQRKNNAYAQSNIMRGRPLVPWARGRFAN